MFYVNFPYTQSGYNDALVAVQGAADRVRLLIDGETRHYFVFLAQVKDAPVDFDTLQRLRAVRTYNIDPSKILAILNCDIPNKHKLETINAGLTGGGVVSHKDGYHIDFGCDELTLKLVNGEFFVGMPPQ